MSSEKMSRTTISLIVAASLVIMVVAMSSDASKDNPIDASVDRRCECPECSACRECRTWDTCLEHDWRSACMCGDEVRFKVYPPKYFLDPIVEPRWRARRYANATKDCPPCRECECKQCPRQPICKSPIVDFPPCDECQCSDKDRQRHKDKLAKYGKRT